MVAECGGMKSVSERCSSAIVSARSFEADEVRPRLVKAFGRALGKVPERYEWEWHPEGSVLFYGDDSEAAVTADFDMVEIRALA